MHTHVPSVQKVVRGWHMLDASGKVLGRMATVAATKLMGKDKTNFARHLDMGDHVVVVNAQRVAVTGNKEEGKLYRRHSGYPGGFKETSLDKLRVDKPGEIVRRAVRGMLPDNKLRERMMKRLHVVIGEENPYAQHFK